MKLFRDEIDDIRDRITDVLQRFVNEASISNEVTLCEPSPSIPITRTLGAREWRRVTEIGVNQYGVLWVTAVLADERDKKDSDEYNDFFWLSDIDTEELAVLCDWIIRRYEFEPYV